MSAVDASYAQALKNDALYLRAVPASAAIWGDRGVSTKAICPLALRDDAVNEATRQATFLAGPNVRDTVTVVGARRDLVGKVVTVRGSRLGYDAGVVCFVIGAAEAAAETVLTVIRKAS